MKRSLNNLDFGIPSVYFKQTITGSENRCLFLFEKNLEGVAGYDDIVTFDQQKDSDSNKGYIIGMPMLRAFQLILDYKEDRVGFADKVHSLGAGIFGDSAPSKKSKADETRENPDKQPDQTG